MKKVTNFSKYNLLTTVYCLITIKRNIQRVIFNKNFKKICFKILFKS